MSAVWRGFRGLRRAPAGKEGRIPPGQYVTDGFPVLSAGPAPHPPLRGDVCYHPHEESMPMSSQSHEETMSMQDKPDEELNETDDE